jgi:hypothetical protein
MIKVTFQIMAGFLFLGTAFSHWDWSLIAFLLAFLGFGALVNGLMGFMGRLGEREPKSP